MPDLKGVMISRGFLLSAVLFLGGCVSSSAHFNGWSDPDDSERRPMVYGGTCHSLLMLSNHEHPNALGEVLATFAFFDLPGSFIMDTVLLPIDLSSDAYGQMSGDRYGKSYCDVLTGS